MDPLLIIALAVAIGSTIAAAVGTVRLMRERDRTEAGAPAPRGGARMLFLMVGSGPAGATVEAAVRLARAEGATLVPAYLALVPESEPLGAADPPAADRVLQRIERRAAEGEVPVEARIQAGRSYRHAMHQLLEAEPFDPIVATAANRDRQGLSPHDVAWLLEHSEADVVVFRPG